tara:strand:- start:733 stop:1314 length:582 start_codon:yes stop_codon:yes gene_type:complete
LIHNTFLSHFHTIIDPPNKEELLDVCENGELHEDQHFPWKQDCEVTLNRISLASMSQQVLGPSIRLFFKELETVEPCRIIMCDAWRNTYNKGDFQEVHDHLPHHLSGVIFLDDYEDGFARFYFHNRHHSEWSEQLSELLDLNSRFHVDGKRGQVLFFPSHMMHGVGIHRSDKQRRTVSFNIALELTDFTNDYS